MTRQWRIGYEGALCHVLSRGNEGHDIAARDKDRKVFVELLCRMCDRFDIELYCYVLMSNHFHLLVKTPRGNLSKSMQWFIGTYTRYYNMQRSRSGDLFQGLFKSFLVEDDAYLLQLSYYIHHNPVRAGLVQRLADYRWSSYRQYACKDKALQCLKVETLLSLFSATDKHGAYRRGCQEYAPGRKEDMERSKARNTFGVRRFCGGNQKQVCDGRQNPGEVAAAKKTSKNVRAA